MTEPEECPVCGRLYVNDLHFEKCRGSAFTGTDTCPMCGEAFDTFLNHMRECDGGRDTDGGQAVE